MKYVEHVAGIGKRNSVCRVLVGKPEWMESLGRQRRGLEGNIKMDF